jgi:uncharacterized damage-inducible protein DinB
MKAHIQRMLRSAEWANREALATLRDAPQSQGEALPLMAHLLAAEHVWLSRLLRRDATVPVWPQLTFDECHKLAAENARGYSSFVEEITEPELATMVVYRNTKGEEFATSVIDILTHVVIHGAYHRGQIARVLGRGGSQAANTDYITFARTVEPAAAKTGS